MAEMIAWLHGVLDDEEKAARAATGDVWKHKPGKMWLPGEAFVGWDTAKGEEFVGHGDSPFRGCIAATGPASDREAMANADHIARHDPAAVLADVAAKRAIIADYENWLSRSTAALEEHGMSVPDPLPPPWVERGRPVRLLASAYRHRDGWKDKWAE